MRGKWKSGWKSQSSAAGSAQSSQVNNGPFQSTGGSNETGGSLPLPAPTSSAGGPFGEDQPGDGVDPQEPPAKKLKREPQSAGCQQNLDSAAEAVPGEGLWLRSFWVVKFASVCMTR